MKKLFTLIGTVLLTAGVNAQTTLKVESFRMGIGEQKTVTLNLDNSDFTDAAAFCCDIVLPEGVEIEANEDGTYKFSVSDKDGRSTSSESLIVASALQSDGAVRVICFPQDASAFAGTSGAILNIPLVASKDLTKGTVEVSIASQEITNTTGLSTIKPDNSTADLTLFLHGDVNDDGGVDGADIQEVINAILSGEYTEYADVNNDQFVDGADIQEVINVILGN